MWVVPHPLSGTASGGGGVRGSGEGQVKVRSGLGEVQGRIR